MARPSGSERFVDGLKDLGSAGRVVISEGGGRLLGRGTGVAGKAAGAAGGGFLGVVGRMMSGVASQAKGRPVIALLVTAFAGIKVFNHFRNRGYEEQQIAEHAQAAQAMENMAAMGVAPEHMAALNQMAAMGMTPAEMAQLAQLQNSGAQLGNGMPPMGPAGQAGGWQGYVESRANRGPLVGAGRGGN